MSSARFRHSIDQNGQDCSVGKPADRHTRQVALHVGLYLAVGERHGHAGANKRLYVRLTGRFPSIAIWIAMPFAPPYCACCLSSLICAVHL